MQREPVTRTRHSGGVTPPRSFSTTRLGVWLPAACFFVFSLILTAASPELGSRLFYALFTLATGYWLFRARRVGIDITENGLAVRGQIRRHRFARSDMRGAGVERMRTASPLQRVVPYVALVIELADGHSRQFEEVSAAASDRSRVQEVADAINAWLTR